MNTMKSSPFLSNTIAGRFFAPMEPSKSTLAFQTSIGLGVEVSALYFIVSREEAVVYRAQDECE
jgi:hypothetical protein